jgi:hypothetical protein
MKVCDPIINKTIKPNERAKGTLGFPGNRNATPKEIPKMRMMGKRLKLLYLENESISKTFWEASSDLKALSEMILLAKTESRSAKKPT